MLKKHAALLSGLALTLLFLVFVFVRVPLLETIESKLYDVLLSVKSDSTPADEIVIVDIDNASIEKMGRWPWPRSLMARVIEIINNGQPRLIGLNIIFSEPQESDGLQALMEIARTFPQVVPEATPQSRERFMESIEAARRHLDHDHALQVALASQQNTVLPIFFKDALVNAPSEDQPAPEIAPFALKAVRSTELSGHPQADEIGLPITPLLSAAKGIGHINFASDADGIVRRERLVYEYRGAFFPSYSLALAAHYLKVPITDIRTNLGDSIRLGSHIRIPVSWTTEMLVEFQQGDNLFREYSFFDVLNGKINPRLFKNKLVLISPSAAGIINPVPTPLDPAMPLGHLSAHTVHAILNQRFIQKPQWDGSAEIGAVLLVGVLLALVLPRLRARWASILFMATLTLFLGGGAYLFVAQGLWLSMVYPLLMLIVGYMAVISLSYLDSEADKDKVAGESAENSRLLGLSFQSQGMLDMAWDKFRKVPVDDEMKDILYNLALDYERKRQINKAAVVYEYIESYDAKYKDVAEKKKRLIQASETLVFGNGFMRSDTSTGLLTTDTGTRPTLGRYEIESKLGQGAMGEVYLGRDPRINRTCAVKTFRIGEDMDPAETEAAKRKFFREAESAGTLSHPNIVTIYDAGHEQDLVFIAMEYLQGDTLEQYIKPGTLMALPRILSVVGDLADALDYAHSKGVVHRDIKPANVMMLEDGAIKLTDFGVARITATSNTQTGIVKGTPYYMSPEQFSGKKVDGRSDIFSLGVLFFQLLTGHLPFHGDSPAVLMNCIINTPHPNPKSLNPRVPTPIGTIIDKMLAKDREKRYPRASLVADRLRQLKQRIQQLIEQKRKAHRQNNAASPD